MCIEFSNSHELKRRVSQNEHGSFNYYIDKDCDYNMILGAVIFFHKFYLYVSKVQMYLYTWTIPGFLTFSLMPLQQYTYIQPPEIRAKVEELFNCEDIFMNGMIADLTMEPGVLMKYSSDSPTPQCFR